MSTRLCFCPDRLHLLHLSPVSLLPQLTAQWCLDGKDSEFRVHNLNCASFLLSLISHCLVTATLRIKYSFFAIWQWKTEQQASTGFEGFDSSCTNPYGSFLAEPKALISAPPICWKGADLERAWNSYWTNKHACLCPWCRLASQGWITWMSARWLPSR